jgi:hypothetical protein
MKKLVLVLLVLVVLAGLAACGRSGKAVTPATSTTTLYHQAGTSSDVYVGSSSGRNSPQVTITQVPAPVITIPPATSTKAPSLAPPGGSGTSSYDSSLPVDRMIIRNANMSLVVDDVNAALTQITSLASAYGGFVVNSNIYESDSRLFANISFRVDSKRFDEAMQTLRDLAADVRQETTSGQDVTEEYVDLTAQLTNLEASESQLLELMKKAGEVADILEVQRELTKTTGEIEQIKGRMQYLEQSSSLALIQVNLEQSKLSIDFNADSRNIKEGNKVTFYARISGGFAPYSYEWNFGDGQTSTEEQPSHSYRDKGTYTVSLIVKDDKGTEIPFERKDYITVLTGWDAGNTVSGVWNALVSFGHFLVSVLIVLGIFSPVWIVILVILYFTVWRRRRKAK